jgi:hypothetical protein
MKHLVLLGSVLFLTACGSDTTALDVRDAAPGGGGGGDSTGGAGGASRGRTDGSIVDPGSGGTTGSGGSLGSTGGTGGTTVPPDAGAPDVVVPKDVQPNPDADELCGQTCPGLMQAYAEAIKKEQVCDPAAPNQCLKQTQGQLVCGCSVWVTTTVISDAVRKSFLDAGCARCIRFTACPAIACVNPGVGACKAVSAQADRPIAPPPAQGQCMAKF